jgi:hypothetical protein
MAIDRKYGMVNLPLTFNTIVFFDIGFTARKKKQEAEMKNEYPGKKTSMKHFM